MFEAAPPPWEQRGREGDKSVGWGGKWRIVLWEGEGRRRGVWVGGWGGGKGEQT